MSDAVPTMLPARRAWRLALAGLLLATGALGGAAGCTGASGSAVPATEAAPEGVSFVGVRPPRGKGTPAVRADLARTIERLARHPLAKGAASARRGLASWVQRQSDLRPPRCGAYTEAITKADTPYRSLLLTQHTLSSAAFRITYPAYADNALYVARAGLEGALTAYRALRAADPEAVRRPSLERLDRRARDGEIAQYLRIQRLDCTDG